MELDWLYRFQKHDVRDNCLLMIRKNWYYSVPHLGILQKNTAFRQLNHFFCLTSAFAEGCVQLLDGKGFSSVRQWPFFFKRNQLSSYLPTLSFDDGNIYFSTSYVLVRIIDAGQFPEVILCMVYQIIVLFLCIRGLF